MWRKAKCSGMVVCALLNLWCTAHASEGVLLMGDDAARDGRGGAAVASPQNAACVMLNPAGLAGLSRRIDTGLSALYYHATLRTQGAARIPFIDETSDDEFWGIPSFAMAWPLGAGVLGLASYTSSGEAIHFGSSRSNVGYVEGKTDRNLDFAQPRLTLAYAYQFDSGWALGASVNGSLSLGRTDQVTPFLLPTEGANDWDTALGAGFGLGIYRHWKRLSVGAGYQSRQWAQVFDKYRDVTVYPVDLPGTLQAGIALRILQSLEVEVDYRFLNWSDTKFFHESNANGGLGWHDQHAVLCGIEWKATSKWAFRAGFSHATKVMTDEHVFGSALVPNIVQDHVTLGFTRALDEASELSVTLGHWLQGRQTESGRGDVYSILGVDTRSTLSAVWLSVGYGRKF